MTPSLLLIVAVVAAAGVMLSLQPPINATLARHAGDPLMASMLSFAVGTLVLLAVVAARGSWSTAAVAGAPWWAWTGGALGAFYVTAMLWAVPQLGVVTTFTILILGQLVAALVIDAVGGFGVPVQDVSWQRILAVAMVAGGVVLSRAY